MKKIIRSIGWGLLAMLILTSVSLAAEKRAGGIKTANRKGANLVLMANHDPASQLENFVLLPGYEVNLFAANPMLENPIHMMWDARGRLWVACSWTYPQLKPDDVADDKIIILEDTNGDGMADKSTVFADGLYIPTETMSQTSRSSRSPGLASKTVITPSVRGGVVQVVGSISKKVFSCTPRWKPSMAWSATLMVASISTTRVARNCACLLKLVLEILGAMSLTAGDSRSSWITHG